MRTKIVLFGMAVAVVVAGLAGSSPVFAAGSCDNFGNIAVGSTTVVTAQPGANEDGPISRPIHEANDGPVTNPDQRPLHQVNCSVVARAEDTLLTQGQQGWLVEKEAYPASLRECLPDAVLSCSPPSTDLPPV